MFGELCPGGYELLTLPHVSCHCKERDVSVLNCEDDQDSIIIRVCIISCLVHVKALRV